MSGNPLKTIPGACGCDLVEDPSGACRSLDAGLSFEDGGQVGDQGFIDGQVELPETDGGFMFPEADLLNLVVIVPYQMGRKNIRWSHSYCWS